MLKYGDLFWQDFFRCRIESIRRNRVSALENRSLTVNKDYTGLLMGNILLMRHNNQVTMFIVFHRPVAFDPWTVAIAAADVNMKISRYFRWTL